jgi:serine/threonine protein kinase
MTDAIPSAVYGKTLQISQELTRGGQGIVWNTDEYHILLKQFEPTFIADTTHQQNDLRHKAARAYMAFCAVNRGHQAELRSLPREYLTFRENPAYLMQRAEGELLQTVLRKKQITRDNKVPIAHAVAKAIHKLHAAQMVHVDVNPENYLLRHDPPHWIVSVIDMDGGGLLSPPGPVYPLSQPKRLYKAPELCTLTWKQLRDRSWFFAPDQWALAVLLYQILVDYEGPFCTVRKHPNPAVQDYIPFKTYAYRDTASQWPLPWQETLLRHAALSDQIISFFYETFQYRFALEKRPRPTAARWEAALRPPTVPPPVVTVSTVPASRHQSPAAPRHPGNGQTPTRVHVRTAHPHGKPPAAPGVFRARRTSVTVHARAFLKGLTAVTHLPARRAGRHLDPQGRRWQCGLRRRKPEGIRTNAS